MKILYTNYYFDFLTGSALYTYDTARHFKERGHDVYIFSPRCGELAIRARKEGIVVTDSINELKDKSFDIIHAHHNLLAYIARLTFPDTPMIYVSHGVRPNLEAPPDPRIGIGRFFAVSEEVCDRLIAYGIDKEQISIARNFVDTEKFSPSTDISSKLKNVLVISNFWKEPNKSKIINVCKKLGTSLTVIGVKTKQVLNTQEYINRADLVITLGRGILESLSCGREALVYDYEYGDGIVSPENIDEIKKCNFSGRRFCIDYSEDTLYKELGKYSSENTYDNRNIIKREFDYVNAMEGYDEVYRNIAIQKVNADLSFSKDIFHKYMKYANPTISRSLYHFLIKLYKKAPYRKGQIKYL